jgi:hypothetical protein
MWNAQQSFIPWLSLALKVALPLIRVFCFDNNLRLFMTMYRIKFWILNQIKLKKTVLIILVCVYILSKLTSTPLYA